MNIRIDSQEPRLNEHFFRTADRMRVEGCVNAVAQEGLSLALSCVHEVLLDHYAQILLQRLRSSTPDIAIDVYFPTNTESLISRFNEALASQSVRQATRNSHEVSRPQIWLVHDAQQLPEQELQLLARLIQNFPGANIRAILLMVGPPPEPQALSAFGRKLLRWDIDIPTDEQAQDALEIARHHGQGEAMALLLRRMGKLRPAAPAWLDESPMSANEARPPVAPGAAAAVPAAQAPASAPDRRWARPLMQLAERLRPQALAGALTQRPAITLQALRQRGPVVGAAVGALALSVLIMMWLQPAAFGLKGHKRAPATDTVQTEAAEGNGTQTTITSVRASAPAPAAIELPDEASDAQAWARALPGQSFLIQHGSMATYDKAQQLVRSYASLRDARIVAAYRPGEKLAHFVVVSGPYEPAGQAYERLRRKDLPNTSWVRSTVSLQQLLAAPAGAQESR